MSGMLNWLIEGATLAGMADKVCLVTKADLDLRHSKKSLHRLCATKLVCPFMGRCSAGCAAYPRTPKASDTPSGCLEFWEQHECYSYRAPMAQAVQHRFSTLLCQCLSLYSPDLQAPPFKEKCLHTFLLPYYAEMFRNNGSLLKQLHYLANH